MGLLNIIGRALFGKKGGCASGGCGGGNGGDGGDGGDGESQSMAGNPFGPGGCCKGTGDMRAAVQKMSSGGDCSAFPQAQNLLG